ncbi:WD repeat domain phosphoinositide-interacting protein 2 isoform X2 [Halyomorpha halys]|uniref:WD repeat domain phosphoinositide-interacting protein 2 isoform X2 n=1 Tax=Halyomorpha halys TaxID=286706 RepID=UPI0006D4F7FE|nr:WD repeat domain phosphoinositide-interacting protein 2 isoform X2 [Halyomorpha halys]
MNFLAKSYDSTKNGIFVSFNQDCTSLAVSTCHGYRILSLNTIDSPQEICESETEDICIVERLFSSSLLAMVSLSSPRKLKVCHFKKGTEICNYSYSNTILAVKLNRARLVVCLEESLFIHNIRDMAVLHTIRDTPPNPSGLCALSTDSDNCYLAYPGSSTIGEVQIFDTVNLNCKMMIAAHDSPLAAMMFSPNGNMIATASEKGTVIRVFNVAEGVKLHEFRRGVKRCVNISGLAFSPDASLLAATSNTETVHVFKLENPKDDGAPTTSSDDSGQGWMGYLSKAVVASATYLPMLQMSVLSQGRAFASAHLPQHGHRNICALTEIQKVLRLLVASSDGYLYVYSIDKAEGGDCNLIKQHRLLKKAEPPVVPHSLRESGSRGGSGDETPETGSVSTYAGILKGNPPGTMSESEKKREIAAAVEKPENENFKLTDDQEFPPVTLKSD